MKFRADPPAHESAAAAKMGLPPPFPTCCRISDVPCFSHFGLALLPPPFGRSRLRRVSYMARSPHSLSCLSVSSWISSRY